MVGIKSFGEAINFVFSNPKLVILPLIVLLAFAPIRAYLQKDISSIYPLEELEKGLMVEEYGAVGSAFLPESFLKKLLFVSLLQLLISSAIQYGIVLYSAEVRRGKNFSILDSLIVGFEHIAPAFLLNILIILIIALFAIVVAFPFLIIIGLGVLGDTHGLVSIGLLLLMFAELVFIPFLVGMTSVVFPAYVLEGSIGKAIKAMFIPLRKKLSTYGFGLLLVLSAIALLVAGSIAYTMVYLLSPNFVGILIGLLLQSPFVALLFVLTSVAGLIFYQNLVDEVKLLSESSGIMPDVRTY
ncbi:hypothetical protein [Pyrococcus sp. ST04]|uniref:hypothetical protein n=1 Tax=Pyrococcus sp. ST04 TaxID=1183377 RepID=UPI0002605F0C|nr:hypothetical protein [Pyrococcus sp. ST04]AFK22636.1 hypothetical protein Py04_1061 [Pyrococcus sp. ST04]